MESIFNFICEHAHYAHWIIFGLLLLTGLNIPISEDLLLLSAGAIASSCLTELTPKIKLFLWVYLGCVLSAWLAYWIGRKLGPKLYDIQWFNRILPPKRIARLHYYYDKFGILTFVVGRFCPGGIRNALFITSGLGQMPFHRFALRDALACLLSCTTLFYIGFLFAENHELILHYFKTYELIVLSLFIVVAISIGSLFYFRYLRKK